MRLMRALLALCVTIMVVTMPRTAFAWIENHVLGDEVTIEVSADGNAVIEHRLTLYTNGSVRFREFAIEGVDADAVPLDNCYVVPHREALANRLDSATPLTLEVRTLAASDGGATKTRLDISVDDKKGLRRGTYVLVLRYRTQLLRAGGITRDGAFTRITWAGPVFEDGFDNARTTFVVPRAPTPPRAVANPAAVDGEGDTDEEDGEADNAATYLSETRRGEATDEVELLRTYAPKGAAVPWAIKVDPRAITGLEPKAESAPDPVDDATLPLAPSDTPLVEDVRVQWGALALFVLAALLTWLKAREVKSLADAASAMMPPIVPLPGWVRAPMAAASLTGGVGLQLLWGEPALGAGLVVVGAVLTAHGTAQLDTRAAMRGPGRWLTVSESEALRNLPRPTGGWLDASTWRGRFLLLLCLGAVGVAVWALAPFSVWHAAVIGGDAVFLLALFGTGMGRAMPPDMTVEPARFLAKVLKRLRRRKDLSGVRIVPRIRIPAGEVDADEVRLLLAPRTPLRGFTAIEIGVTYAIGLGARVAMPEVLLRVVADSACDQAVGGLSRFGRIAPGRKREERTIGIAPRFPTARMTAEIAAALAIRVIDRNARTAAKTSEGGSGTEPTRRPRRDRKRKVSKGKDKSAEAA